MKQFKGQASMLLFLLLIGLSLLFAWHEQQAVEENVLVHVIDIGQADCMVLETPHGNILVDSGADVSERQLRAYLKSHGLHHFAYMILSHPHDDHMGNADMLDLKEGKSGLPHAHLRTFTTVYHKQAPMHI